MKILLTIILLLTFLSPTYASLFIQPLAFSYSPDYGDLREHLEGNDPFYDTPERLGPDSGLAFSGGYAFSNRWCIRLDTFSFTGVADYRHLKLPDTFFFTVSVSPALLNAIYQPTNWIYVGGGIGTFPSKLTVEANIPSRNYQGSTSPTGFQLLIGTQYKFRNGLFLSGEARYLSAKAEFPEYRCLPSCNTDW